MIMTLSYSSDEVSRPSNFEDGNIHLSEEVAFRTEERLLVRVNAEETHDGRLFSFPGVQVFPRLTVIVLQ